MMTKTTVKKDAAGELALKMISALEELRRKNSDSYPPTVQRLAQESDPQALPIVLRKAINKPKEFHGKVVVARRGDILSPVALIKDAPKFVESPRVIEYLLRWARTPSNSALSVAQLQLKVSGKLKKPFATSAHRLIDENGLPPGIAWIFVNGTRKLFLMEDLNGGVPITNRIPQLSENQDGVNGPIGSPIPTSPADFSREFDIAFENLNRREGSINFVSLVDLRRALESYPRAIFDHELRNLWSQGQYSLRAAEGRFGVSPEEREAGFLQEGALLLFVSRNSR
jgi:hypothetical protein